MVMGKCGIPQNSFGIQRNPQRKTEWRNINAAVKALCITHKSLKMKWDNGYKKRLGKTERFARLDDAP